jgi:hypothetical protein
VVLIPKELTKVKISRGLEKYENRLPKEDKAIKAQSQVVSITLRSFFFFYGEEVMGKIYGRKDPRP